MKALVYFVLLVLVLGACAGGSKNVDNSKSKVAVVNADSLGMVEALHTFFKWYEESGQTLYPKINFVNTSAKHPTIDLSILARYLGEFSKSGAICTEFIQNETIFYRACSLAWENENSNETITGFDMDRYYCAQDSEPKEFQTAGISYQIEGDRANVELKLDPNGPNGGPRNFEMKKENGKWLISKNGCEAYLHR